jgi:hypothetical protein
MRLAKVVLNDPEVWWVLKNEKRRTEIVTLIGKLREVHAVVLWRTTCADHRTFGQYHHFSADATARTSPNTAAMALVMRRAP